MLPILKWGSKGPAVQDLQWALNYHKRRFRPSRHPELKEDGIFGPKTDVRVREFQSGNGLVADGQVGPLTRAQLFINPHSRVKHAQEIAVGWTLMARAAIQKLSEVVTRARQTRDPGSLGVPKEHVEALATHFHIDLIEPPNLSGLPPAFPPYGEAEIRGFLTEIEAAYGEILRTLQEASIDAGNIFFFVGPYMTEADGIPRRSTSGYAKYRDRVNFTEYFSAFDAPNDYNRRANVVIHECAHYVNRKISDYAYELPKYRGFPATHSKFLRYYDELRAGQAVYNAPSYAAFAQHVVFLCDIRFAFSEEPTCPCGNDSPNPLAKCG